MAGAEAVGVAALAVRLLLFESDTDVLKLKLEFGIGGVEGCETAESLDGSLITTLLDEETGRLGQPEHTGSEDGSPDELDGSGDTPSRVVVAVLGGVVYDGSEEKTDGDGPLVSGYNGTTDPFRRTFGLVHGDESGYETNTDTSNDTADDEGCPLV